MLAALLADCRRPANKTGLEGRSLPEFSMLLMDSVTQFASESIKAGKPAVLFYFSPRCPYCKAQVDQMIANIDDLKDTWIYMISDYPVAEMKQFYQKYKLGSYSNISMLYDPAYSFANYFKVTGVPYTAVYGKDRKLKGVYMGPATPHDIVALANE